MTQDPSLQGSQILREANHSALIQSGNSTYMELFLAHNSLKAEVSALQNAYHLVVQSKSQAAVPLADFRVLQPTIHATSLPQSHHTLSTPSPMMSVPPSRAAYPKVTYWTKGDWKPQTMKDSTIFNQAASARGKARGSKGENVTVRYIEDENGAVIDGFRVNHIRELMRQIFQHLHSCGAAPETWGAASLPMQQYYREQMYAAFPELRLCEGHWKAEKLATETYPGWYRCNVGGKGVKQENQDDAINADEAQSGPVSSKRTMVVESVFPAKKVKRIPKPPLSPKRLRIPCAASTSSGTSGSPFTTDLSTVSTSSTGSDPPHVTDTLTIDAEMILDPPETADLVDSSTESDLWFGSPLATVPRSRTDSRPVANTSATIDPLTATTITTATSSPVITRSSTTSNFLGTTHSVSLESPLDILAAASASIASASGAFSGAPFSATSSSMSSSMPSLLPPISTPRGSTFSIVDPLRKDLAPRLAVPSRIKHSDIRLPDEAGSSSETRKVQTKDGPIHPTKANSARNLYLIDYKKEHPNALKSEFNKAWESLDEATLARYTASSTARRKAIKEAKTAAGAGT